MSASEKVGPFSIRSLPQRAGVARFGSSAPVSALDRWLVKKLVDTLAMPTLRIVLWDGSDAAAPDASPSMTLRVHDAPTLRRLVFKPSLGFGDGYSSGHVEIEGDLVRFLEQCYACVARARRAHPRLLRALDLIGAAARRSNTLDCSRANIYSHYDIGNDFYKLWLDEQMLYTCAYYPTDDTTLEQAQIAKMDHVCRKLRLEPGMSVVETGCGWGALALHMARYYGVSVEAYNISHEQILYARQRAQKMGLADRVKFIEEDYRNVTKTFDRFVSVGMLEHVGVDHFGELSQTIDRSLSPKGVGLIHSIGRNYPSRLDPWISTRIFPGACPPTLGQMGAIFEPAELSVLDVENIRLHYARTCADWLHRFEENREKVTRMFDENFLRAWRLYLAGSVAAFTSGGLQLFQVVFARHNNNDLPATRSHLYAEDAQRKVADAKI